jgi:hypothetical protein
MKKANDLPSPAKILTVEQFAERMQVSRTTVFGWLKSGVLVKGVHYFRLGRILRFCWQEGLFFNSQQKPVAEDEGRSKPIPPNRSELDSQRGEATVNSKPLTLRRAGVPTVNIDY